MAIGVIFRFGAEAAEVRVIDKNLYFRTSSHQQWGDIDGLKLDKQGVIKEHPDLKDNKDWQKIAKKRLKEKLRKMKTEKERIKYVIEDLKGYGYKAEVIQEDGFRPQKIRS